MTIIGYSFFAALSQGWTSLECAAHQTDRTPWYKGEGGLTASFPPLINLRSHLGGEQLLGTCVAPVEHPYPFPSIKALINRLRVNHVSNNGPLWRSGCIDLTRCASVYVNSGAWPSGFCIYLDEFSLEFGGHVYIYGWFNLGQAPFSTVNNWCVGLAIKNYWI